MKVTITPGKLSGAIQVPPSKSQAHRLIIGAALADGTSHIHNLAHSQDICATLDCMTQLGAVAAPASSRRWTAASPVPPSASSCRWRWPWLAAACSGGGDG